MIRVIRTLIICLTVTVVLIVTGRASVAQEIPPPDVVDPDIFKDWLTLSDFMASQGINIVGTDWLPIEAACLPLKTEEDETQYNRCRYRKALDQRDFAINNRGCNTQSLAANPDILAVAGTQTVIVKDPSGKTKTVQQVITPLSSIQLYANRRGFYIDCMNSYGWINPDSWLAGRR